MHVGLLETTPPLHGVVTPADEPDGAIEMASHSFSAQVGLFAHTPSLSHEIEAEPESMWCVDSHSNVHAGFEKTLPPGAHNMTLAPGA